MRVILLIFGLVSVTLSFAQDTAYRRDYFETDRSLLNDSSLGDLQRFLDRMEHREVVVIQLKAYCDDRASEAYNKELALRRANALGEIYRQVWPDLSPKQVVVDEWGELPLSGSDTVALRASNRRVESVIILKPEADQDEFTNLKVGDKVVLKNLLFIGGRHVLLPESEPYLDSLLNKVRQYDQYKFKISGHICCQPPGMDGLDWDTKQRNLSVARAKVIYDYLIKHGVSANRLEYVGHGSNFKLGGPDKFDRRVEIEVMGTVEE